MTQRIVPYLSFDGGAQAAMTFYRTALGGELEMVTYGQSSMATTPDDTDRIMHAELRLTSGFSLMAADGPSGSPAETESRVSVSLIGDDSDVDAMQRSFTALAEGGTVAVPFEKAPWGDVFGMLQDRFGITWMFNADGGARFDG